MTKQEFENLMNSGFEDLMRTILEVWNKEKSKDITKKQQGEKENV